MKCVSAKQGFAGKAHDNVFFGDTVATSSPLDTKCVSSAGVRPLTSADGGRGDKVIASRPAWGGNSFLPIRSKNRRMRQDSLAFAAGKLSHVCEYRKNITYL